MQSALTDSNYLRLHEESDLSDVSAYQMHHADRQNQMCAVFLQQSFQSSVTYTKSFYLSCQNPVTPFQGLLFFSLQTIPEHIYIFSISGMAEKRNQIHHQNEFLNTQEPLLLSGLHYLQCHTMKFLLEMPV